MELISSLYQQQGGYFYEEKNQNDNRVQHFSIWGMFFSSKTCRRASDRRLQERKNTEDGRKNGKLTDDSCQQNAHAFERLSGQKKTASFETV